MSAGHNSHDVAIVGSGFAGTILARALNRQGLSVLLVERGRHPRFALGESSTPLAGFALERLAERYGLDDLHQLSTYGRWCRHLPHLRRGLKRGFTFYAHRHGRDLASQPGVRERLLVAASPDDEIADTHWLRADVDHHLVQQAVREGVDYRDDCTLTEAEEIAQGLRLRGHWRGCALQVQVSWVIDASGPGGFLAAALGIPDRRHRQQLSSSLLYAHLGGLPTLEQALGHQRATWRPGPYGDEQAAVHHLLAEGWLYLLPFDHGVASCGLVLDHSRVDNDLLKLAAAEPRQAFLQVLSRYPTLYRQLGSAREVTPLRFQHRIQHRVAFAVGSRWALLPHTHSFSDPMFSTGMAWSLLAAERLARQWEKGAPELHSYGRLLNAEANQIGRLLQAATLAGNDLDLLAPVSFLYFAAVSHEELLQRLGLAGEAPANRPFLGALDTHWVRVFREARRRLAVRPAQQTDWARDFAAWVATAIARHNVIGLCDPSRQDLYPVDLEVLLDRSQLLGLDREQLRGLLPRLRGTNDA